MTKVSLRSMIYSDTPNNWLCNIDTEYLLSSVSYYGLNQHVHHINSATQLIKGAKVDKSAFDPDKLNELINCAKLLYGLLHARFICTYEGIYKMKYKYRNGVFGVCPRAECGGWRVLPIGLSSVPGVETVKVFCPRCQEVYNCNSTLDAAFFGPDFPLVYMKIDKMPYRTIYHPMVLKERETPDGKKVPPIQQRLVHLNQKK